MKSLHYNIIGKIPPAKKSFQYLGKPFAFPSPLSLFPM